MSRVFFPVHENSHWYLLIWNNEKKTLEILDPYKPLSNITLPRKYKKKETETRDNKIAEVELNQKEKATFILQEYILKLNASLNSYTYRIVHRKDIPEQQNSWDCGVFMLMFMKYTALNKEFNFDTSHMQFFREVIRKEIQNK